MEFSYYPGCSLKGSAKELDDSFCSVSQKLGVTLREIPDWACCGASSAHMVDHYLEAALPANDLMKAERMGRDVVAPCPGCHVRMKAASQRIFKEPELARQFPFKGTIKVLSGSDMFSLEGVMQRLKERKVKSLEGLKIVPYYGCLAVRPVEVVEPDDPETARLAAALLQPLEDWEAVTPAASQPPTPTPTPTPTPAPNI